MKKLASTYTFNAAAKTIQCADFTSLEKIALITNVTTQVIIYNFADTTKGATLAGTTITLEFDTTAMSNTDKLQIILHPDTVVSTIPGEGQEAIVVQSKPQYVNRIGFSKAIAAGLDTDFFSQVILGSGMARSQSGGNAIITSGTTARSESIWRSNKTYNGGIRLRVRSTLSQRIVNNNFIVELVDVIGDALAYSIGSATAITVTIPSNPFTSANVGQNISIGGFSGTGTFFSGRYPIASVSGNDVTFTVSAFAVGTGTCSLFGLNFYRLLYDGTTATQSNFDTGRNGYASGNTLATINTTAAPGHIAMITGNDTIATLADQLVASGATIKQLVRATRDEMVPDDSNLRLQIRVVNGTTAPATTTTWTIGAISVSNYASQDVAIQDMRPMAVGMALPVELMRTVTIPTTLTSTTITANTPGVAAANLGKAEDAVAASGDTGVFVLAVRRDGAITTAPASAAGDYSEIAVDNFGQVRQSLQARTTNPTAAADGNGVIPITDKLGKQVVVGSVRDLKANQVTTITASVAETTIVTAVASTFLDLYGIIITNTSATAVNVAIKDATAGTTRFNIAVPAGETRGFMLPESGAIKQSAVNGNWTATVSASVTSVIITALTVANT